MIMLLNFFLGAFFSACLVVILRLFPRFGVPSFPAVVVNYLTCVSIGVLMSSTGLRIFEELPSRNILLLLFILGGVFILTFYIMALTTQAVGVTVASVFIKISMVVPILFSLFVWQNANKVFDFWNYAGLVLSGVAIVLSSWQGNTRSKNTENTPKTNWGIWLWILPLLAFSFSGGIDTTLNWLDTNYKTNGDATMLPIFIFASAGIWGVLVLGLGLIFKGIVPTFRALLGGIALGLPNFFSLYFMFRSLKDFASNGALFFPLFNISIILISGVAGWVIFGEKLSKINKLGAFLALLAIALIAYQELFSKFLS